MTFGEALRRSAEELGMRAEAHRRLLAQAVEGGDAYLNVWALPDCPHRRLLRETLAEVIETLERTRKAFKSKQLEVLRRKLVRLLADEA